MEKHFKELMKGIISEQKELLENSSQAVYIYLDDVNKVCNRKFASMLGYKSPEEWANVTQNIPAVFAEKKSVNTLINAYRDAMEKMKGSTINVTWTKKTKGTVDTNVILVPVIYKNHSFAMHFVAKK
jgi:hypothetical protein